MRNNVNRVSVKSFVEQINNKNTNNPNSVTGTVIPQALMFVANNNRNKALLVNRKAQKPSHMGLLQENTVINLNGKESTKRLTYLDSTASALANRQIQKEAKSFLRDGYANTHTTGHHRGRDSTEAVNKARDSVGKFVGYDSERDFVTFQGTGATGPLNYLAQVLFPKELRIFNNPEISTDAKNEILKKSPSQNQVIAREMMGKPIIITTEMEHHANQLPWFDCNVKFVPVDSQTGELDLGVLQKLLDEHKGNVRLVSVSGASNITGIMNPIHDIAKMAHEAGAEICVDAAQLAPHHKIEKRRADKNESLDYIVMSPHKFGVTGTPGVLVANNSLLDGRRNLVSLGGGIVNTVTVFPPEFTVITDLATAEEPGTPNVVGIIKVGLAAAKLSQDMDKLASHEKELTASLMGQLSKLEKDGIRIIGSKAPEKRVGVVSFEVEGVPHEVVTSYLNDSWNIAVRNGCFCAQPLVGKMNGMTKEAIDKIKQGDNSDKPGYVRASFGEHSTKEDVNTLVEALTELVNNKQKVNDLYEIDEHGNALRRDGFKQEECWSFKEAVSRLTQGGTSIMHL